MKTLGKKLISGLLLTMMLGALVACSAKQEGMLSDVAAIRLEGEDQGKIFIDDKALPLAARASLGTKLDEARVLAYDLCNTQRRNSGLADFVSNKDLEDAAWVRAGEIVSVFSHTRPDGSAFWTVNSNVQWGENLAKLYNSAESVVAAWMASPTHAANILAGDFKTVGISIRENGNDWYWAQEFGY